MDTSVNVGSPMNEQLVPQKSTKKTIKGKLLAPRDLFDDNQHTYVKRSLIEIVIYLLFLIVLSILAYGSRKGAIPRLANFYKELFVNKVFTVNDLYISTFNQLILPTEYYWFVRDVLGVTLNQAFIANENLIVGAGRLRQVRVRSESCVVPANFLSLISSCYAPYSPSAESTDPVQLEMQQLPYLSADALRETPYAGNLATYGGGGVSVTLPMNRDTQAVKLMVNNLFLSPNSNWISYNTRAIFADFLTYNANVNVFCFVRLLAEFTPTAGIITSAEILTVNLLDESVVQTMAEFIIYGFVVWFLIQEVIKLLNYKLGYFGRIWNYTNLAVIVSAGFMAFFRMRFKASVSNDLTDQTVMEAFNNTSECYFRELAYAQIKCELCVALLVFFAWIKLFRYCDVTDGMSEAMIALNASIKGIVGFGVMFFVVLLAFVHLGHLMFGHYIESFSTFSLSLYTMFLMSVGNFDVSVINQEFGIAGPVFVYLFVFVILFILLNMFAAIINESFRATKLVKAARGRILLFNYIRKLAGGRHFQMWSENMIKLGYNSEDVETISEQFGGVKGGKAAALEQEMTQALDSLAKSPGSAAKRVGSHLDQLIRRVEALEVNLSRLDAQLDEAVNRFRVAEQRKQIRNTAFIQLIDVIIEVKSVSHTRRRALLAFALKQELDRLNNLP